MHNKLCFVQFIHPGGEHKPDDGLNKKWNTGKHQRKFLRRTGRYVTGAKVEKGELLFWGEWEPESRVEREIDDPIPRGPRFIYEPYYVVPKSYRGLQNTDPFVFGEQFHYTVCKQPHFSSLRHLSRGSVILFGSCKDFVFVLDTVFVVGDRWIDHTKSNYKRVLKGKISQEYEEVTIIPWYQEPCAGGKACDSADSQGPWRLYFGASYDKPLGDMYSFFPCQRYEAKSRGFARPRISLPGIADKQPMGIKLTYPQSPDEMKLLWEKVAEQVKEQGLALGVYAEMPERRNP